MQVLFARRGQPMQAIRRIVDFKEREVYRRLSGAYSSVLTIRALDKVIANLREV